MGEKSEASIVNVYSYLTGYVMEAFDLLLFMGVPGHEQREKLLP